MNNNDIFKKLRVALQLRDDQIVEILQLVDFRITTTELSAFFRNEEHPKYMDCGDQVLRNFLNGLVIHLRGTKENPKQPLEVIKSHKISAPSAEKQTPKKEQNPKASTSTKKKFTPKKTVKKPTIVEKVIFKNGKKSK